MDLHRDNLRQLSMSDQMPTGTVTQLGANDDNTSDWPAEKIVAHQIVKKFNTNTMTSDRLELKRDENDNEVGGASKSMMVLDKKKTSGDDDGVFDNLLVLKTVEKKAIRDLGLGMEWVIYNDMYETQVANFFYALCSDKLPNDVKKEVQNIKTGLLISIKVNGVVQHHYVDSNLKDTMNNEVTRDWENLQKAVQEAFKKSGSTYVTHFIMTKLQAFDEDANFETCEKIMLSAHDKGIVHCDLKRENLCCIEIKSGKHVGKHVVPIDFGFVTYENTQKPEAFGAFELYKEEFDLGNGEAAGEFYAHRLGTLCPFDIKKAIRDASGGKTWEDLEHENRIAIAKLYDTACLAVIGKGKDVEMMCWPQNFVHCQADLNTLLLGEGVHVAMQMGKIFMPEQQQTPTRPLKKRKFSEEPVAWTWQAIYGSLTAIATSFTIQKITQTSQK